MAKKERYNPLEIQIRMIALPGRIPALRYWQTLAKAIRTGADLPRGWEVDIHWRNPETRHGVTKRWRSDDFVEAISDSRAGFVTAVLDVCAAKVAYHQERTAWAKRKRRKAL